ncbi:MAG: hypothetical protein WKF35_02920 [Ferruginibacter sp.]
MKKILLMLLAIVTFITGFAQEKEKKRNKKEERRQRIDAIAKQEEEGIIVYKKHFAFGGKLTSDGYGGFLEVGKAQSVKRGLLFQLDISERKHPREEKQQVQFSQTVPIIYTKVNFFYPVKLGIQQQLVLGNKGNKNGISVTGNIGGGLIVGLLRPYMIDLVNNGERGYISYFDDSTAFLNSDSYIKGPTFGKGWSDIKVTPGIYVKPAFRFDYGKYNEMINAIEVGLTAEFYSKEIKQMVFRDSRRYFFTAYVAIVFGRRK